VGQFPWQVSVQYTDIYPHHFHTCGGTIIDSTHIACAAHCIDTRQAQWFLVKAGIHNVKELFPVQPHLQKRHVVDMWMHEEFDPTVFTNDISILKLDEPLEFNEWVQPLPLAAMGADPAGGTVCVNSGWGSISDTPYPEMPTLLQYVEMPIVARPDCAEDYSDTVVDKGMVCAGIDEGGLSACSGDSGGPLACPDQSGALYLAGIVSWGIIPCGQANRPSVFTNVGYFREWIDQHLAM